MTDSRDLLIDAALTHVPFEGMNARALAAGARDAGIAPAMVPVLVPDGGAGLAAAYHRRGDARLAAWMEGANSSGRFRDRIAEAVWQRIRMADRELVRAGAATLALPQNSALAARLVWETADVIWTGLGDPSRDVNWYSKRATLAAVIGSSVLYWLGDDSADQKATREFIDRRIDGVMGFEKVKARLRNLPGAETLTGIATGWIRAPEPRDLPGRTKEKT
ncbi:COQ9 family protein [Paracoccus sp. TK19116]|uniref:COQ9 family protein n=1 Tax=Paracoccus albicereus TaxID=2922394 RepID=A0ABT1MV93_9RHOB|nr:COQ9 family protein [Paracoccus albicereus]MCQ0971391.1 COQ9 family protein [Paracoccus albicereus]